MTGFKVLGLAGNAGSGKDYLTQQYFVPLGWKQFSFAWHLKVWAVGRGEATHDEVFRTKPPHIRKFLQEEGTERGRLVYGEDLWCRVAAEWMQVLHENMGIEKFIIPDVRFPNEANFVKDLGGYVFQIKAPTRVANNGLSDEARRHQSETALDLYTNFDGFILNDPEFSHTVEDSCHRVNSLFDPSDCTDEFPALDYVREVLQDIRDKWWF